MKVTDTIAKRDDRVRRLLGRAPCCGATNGRCDSYAESFRWPHTGCDNCGHPRGCHYR